MSAPDWRAIERLFAEAEALIREMYAELAGTDAMKYEDRVKAWLEENGKGGALGE